MRVAVIGCGKQGPRHAAAFASCTAVSGLAMADLDPERSRAAARRLGADFAESVDAVLADASIAAVVIATPTPSHHALARRALAAKKHVLCEKPFGAETAAARRLAEAAAAAGLVGRVGYLDRFAPAIAAARSLVAAGLSPALGQARTAEFAIAAPGGQARWKHCRDTAGGAVNELLSHLLDLAVWFFGPARDCDIVEKRIAMPCRMIAGAAAAVDAEDRVVARLAMRSGVAVTVRGDFAAPRFAQSLEIRGDNGMICASIDPAFASFYRLDRPAAGLAAGRYALPPSAAGELYRCQAQSFLAAIGGAPDMASGGCGFAAAAEVSHLLESLRAGPVTPAGRPAA